MSIIAKTEALPRSKNRMALKDEDGTVLAVFYRSVLKKAEIKEGMELTEELYRVMVEAEKPLALEGVLFRLGQRPYAEKELERYCRRLKYEEPVLASVMEKVLRYGFVDDSDLSQRQAETLIGRGLSRTAVRQKLMLKGFDRDTVDRAMEACDAEDEQSNADALAETLWYRYRNGEPMKRRQKASAAMARKGFSWETIRSALRKVSDGDDELE